MRRMKYHIEKNTVQETLIIPLFGRLVCSERFPALFSDPEAKRICDALDYDFAEKRRKMESPAGLFGALEVAQRQYDLRCEVEAYLKDHPRAAVVNLGCGLDDTFSKCDNGLCRGYNIDFPDVIEVRNQLLPAIDRETNLACDLNDYGWMEKIDASGGAVFFAAGVFYYFKTEDVRRLFDAMARRFPGGALAFDACNQRGARLMRKTWLKEAGITKNLHWHSLRGSAGSFMLEHGMHMEDVSVLMGHASISTTEKFYTWYTEKKKRESLNVMEGAYKKKN